METLGYYTAIACLESLSQEFHRRLNAHKPQEAPLPYPADGAPVEADARSENGSSGDWGALLSIHLV